MEVTCDVCMHHCKLKEKQTGFCRVRKNVGGKIISLNYGKLVSLVVDPVEKKPLRRFYPGHKILSVGTFGCNMRCPFCQNFQISMANEKDVSTTYVSSELLVSKAKELQHKGNIGIAFTYNEPLIGYEYVQTVAQLAQNVGLRTVAVTNGSVTTKIAEILLPHLDALNIDLKGFTTEYYQKLGGDLETVKRFIELAAPRCHVELTTLIVPGENDSEDEMRALSAWVASLNEAIPLHISRFFPRYNMVNKEATAVSKVYRLAEIAREKLQFVYTGNC